MTETKILESIRDLASQQAEIVRRMGASYGSRKDWRRDIQIAVGIMETMCCILGRKDDQAKSNTSEAIAECWSCPTLISGKPYLIFHADGVSMHKSQGHDVRSVVDARD